MKQHQSNYMLLASITALLIFSAGMLNYQKHIMAADISPKMAKNPLDELSLDNAYASLQHLLASRSVGTIVQMLNGVSIDRAVQLCHMMLSSKSIALTREDRALVILGLTNNYTGDIKKQYQLLDMLKQFRDIKKDKPLLISAIHSEYAQIIPVLISWMKERQLDALSIENAWTYAIQHNDVAGLSKLVAHGVAMTSAQATKLLQQTVSQKRMVEFVPLLVDLGADIDYVKQGKTFLMQAVLQHNTALVTALLKAGAHKNINKIIDPRVGSALQLAIEKEYSDIDVLLRDYGARE